MQWAAEPLTGDGRVVVVQACRPRLSPPQLRGGADDRHRLAGASVDELLLAAPRELLDCELDIEVSEQDPVSALIAAAERHGAEAIVPVRRRSKNDKTLHRAWQQHQTR